MQTQTAERPRRIFANPADYLARSPLLSELSPGELALLANATRPRVYQEGEVIFHKDDPGNGLHIVTKGTIKISLIAPDGQETLLALMAPGECFGELAVLDGGPRSASATAMERSETLYLPREAFLSFLDRHRDVLMKLVVLLSKRLRDTDEQIGDLVFHDVYSRLAKRLLELGGSHGVQTPGGVQINLPLTQQDLANLVGASRESINKAMKYFRDRDCIAVATQRITILRPDLLERRARM